MRLPAYRSMNQPARGLFAFIVLAAATFSVEPVVVALSPESPEVQAAVTRGTAFLELHSQEDHRLGARALLARVMLHRNPDHPAIPLALKAIDDELAKGVAADVYSVGLAIVLLTEIDAVQYRPQIEGLAKHLVKIQKPHGGWGYPNQGTGDTSMTQYAVLGLWSAWREGIDAPLKTWEGVANWLLRTQDPSGCWGYQGVDPNTFELVPQVETGPTMCLAGLGSLYLCGDRLGLVRIMSNAEQPKAAETAQGFKRVEDNGEAGAALTALTDQVDRKIYFAALERGNAWQKSHFHEFSQTYPCYFFYTLERLETFRDLVTTDVSRPKSASTDITWYNNAATYLIREQIDKGNWKGSEGGVPATSLAILCLLRATHKTVAKLPPALAFGAGTLIGGRGLPSTENEVELRYGRVQVKPLMGPADELLSRIDDPNNPDRLRAIEALDDLTHAGDTVVLNKHAKKLRELAGDTSPEARATALRALGRSRNLDHVPVLVDALSDPDAKVWQEALAGLRYIRRQLDKPTEPADWSAEQRAVEAERWKIWYLSIRPNADLTP